MLNCSRNFLGETLFSFHLLKVTNTQVQSEWSFTEASPITLWHKEQDKTCAAMFQGSA